jgi:hypothetical protein
VYVRFLGLYTLQCCCHREHLRKINSSKNIFKAIQLLYLFSKQSKVAYCKANATALDYVLKFLQQFGQRNA